MKNKILFIIILILITGCSVEYNLNIDNSFSEHTVYIPESSEEMIDVTQYRLPALFSESRLTYDNSNLKEIKYYNIKTLKDNKFSFNFVYDDNQLNDSNIANTCYQFFSVDTKENEVSILTGNKFYCFDVYEELDLVTININSNYKVIQSNADKIVGKKHTWYITRENASNKPIIFVYDKSKKNMTIMQYLIDNVPLVVVVGTTLMLGGITFLIINTKKKKANKI